MCDNLQMVCAICRIGIYTLCRRVCCCKGPPKEKPEFSVLCVGLSKTGKSTILCVLSGEDINGIEPTVGFSIKAVIMDNCILNVKELGGCASVRQYWDRYFQGSQALIYVLAAACTEEEMETNKGEFHRVVTHPSHRSLPLLVLVTGQEKGEARTEQQISDLLDLQTQRGKRPVIVQSCCTDNKVSLVEGFTKLCNILTVEPETTATTRTESNSNGKESNKI